MEVDAEQYTATLSYYWFMQCIKITKKILITGTATFYNKIVNYLRYVTEHTIKHRKKSVAKRIVVQGRHKRQRNVQQKCIQRIIVTQKK